MHHDSMVDNAPVGGAWFQVDPLVAAPPDAATTAPESADETDVTRLFAPAQANLSPHTEPETIMTANPETALVLIVEDNPDMCRFIGEALMGTYRIATAADGNTGLAQALALQPDLILSDMAIPTMSGVQLVQAVRAYPELAAIPLVLLTAKTDERLPVEMFTSGMQDYLVKPFSPEELRARLANLIELKRTRELLQRELVSQNHDLADLVHEVILRKHELEQTLQEQVRLYEETRQALRLRDEFLAIAAHELKTPLTSLVGIAQVLARRSAGQDTLSERDRRAVRTIYAQGTRLNQMIEMLFDLARMDQGQFEIKPVLLDLGDLLRRVVEETRSTLEQHTIELQEPGETVIIAGDRLRLEQVFHNLLGNAIKYSPQGGLIQVALERQEAMVRIPVTDHGVGIPAEALSQLFQRFYRVPNMTYHHISGMGLGLSIVQEIIRHHNGWVDVMSTEDVGSTFIVWLPLHTAVPLAQADADHTPHAFDNGV